MLDTDRVNSAVLTHCGVDAVYYRHGQGAGVAVRLAPNDTPLLMDHGGFENHIEAMARISDMPNCEQGDRIDIDGVRHTVDAYTRSSGLWVLELIPQ